MFVELMPLLAQRAVHLTVSRIDVATICVNVIPKRLGDDENPALTTPLSFTGSPQELDQELARQLVEYVGSHLQLGSTLRAAKSEMEAAAKAAKEEARRKTTAKPPTAEVNDAKQKEVPSAPTTEAASQPSSLFESSSNAGANGKADEKGAQQ